MAKLLASSSSRCNCFCRQNRTSTTSISTTYFFLNSKKNNNKKKSLKSSSRRSMMHPRHRGAALNNNSNNDDTDAQKHADDTDAQKHADENGYPHLIVFDLDACFWNQEMYQLYDICESKDNIVDEKTNTVVGAVSGRTVIRMHEGSRKALTEYYEGKYPGARLATASSADTPLAVKIGQSALRNLEIAPGVSAASVFAIGWEKEFDGNMQIGRTPPLSANKAQTHFPILRKFTNIEYHKMLFFDDCNWGDHCAAVESQCVEPKAGLGPAIQRTPRGLGVKEWETALAKYKARHEQYFQK